MEKARGLLITVLAFPLSLVIRLALRITLWAMRQGVVKIDTR